MEEIGKNTILYGPPGTGKTYHTVNYAVAVIEGKPLEKIQAENHDSVLYRFKQYLKAGRIARRGFKSGYTTVQENAPCLRGKLLFAQHIRANFVHQERLYAEHDIFSSDCAENRIIKAALCRLLRFARLPVTRRDLQTIPSALRYAHLR